MFEITPYNKISLTKGDTAAFNCEIVDLDGKERTPLDGDVLTLSLDDTDFSIVASNNAQYLFSISGADTANLEEGVYLYRVVLDTADGGRYTIFQNNIFDLLGGEAGEEPVPPTPPEPTPTLTASITFNDPSCSVGENVTVSMNIQGNTEIAGVQTELSFDMGYLECLGVSGSGLGNLSTEQERDGYLTILDYAGTRADELSYINYQIMFRAKQAGTTVVSVSTYTIVDNEHNTFDVNLFNSEITISENNNLPEEP